jgi:hypothetical protein
MAATWLATGLALVFTAFQGTASGASVAESVNFRDGSVLLGQLAGVDRRGELDVIVERAWAEANLPDLVAGWERNEADVVRRARLERRERLVVWRQSRSSTAPPGDPVMPWIAREVTRMSDPRPPRTVLMRVALPVSEVRSVTPRDPESSRLLRLGWLAGISGVEAMSAESLREVLVTRGGVRPDDPAAVAALLPLASETEATWLRRRGATAALVENDLRFVRFHEFILPESGPEADVAAPANTTQLLDSPAAQEAYRSILAVTPADPVRVRLDLAASRGRVGAIVSRVDFQIDSASAEAETALWVRQEGVRGVRSRRDGHRRAPMSRPTRRERPLPRSSSRSGRPYRSWSCSGRRPRRPRRAGRGRPPPRPSSVPWAGPAAHSIRISPRSSCPSPLRAAEQRLPRLTVAVRHGSLPLPLHDGSPCRKAIGCRTAG